MDCISTADDTTKLSEANMYIENLTQQPQAVTFTFCSACQIHTNHKQTPSGSLVCWCGNVDEPQTITEQRRESILYAVAQDPGLLTDEVIAELAELDGSDTSVQTQLFDAGFGSGGIY